MIRSKNENYKGDKKVFRFFWAKERNKGKKESKQSTQNDLKFIKSKIGDITAWNGKHDKCDNK